MWFRFRVLKAPTTAFYIFCRLRFNPYESEKPLNFGWLFKNKVATTPEENIEFQKDKESFLTLNQLSSWIKTFNPKRKYCWMHVMVMPSNLKAFPDARRSGLNNLEIEFQLSTRPDGKIFDT